MNKRRGIIQPKTHSWHDSVGRSTDFHMRFRVKPLWPTIILCVGVVILTLLNSRHKRITVPAALFATAIIVCCEIWQNHRARENAKSADNGEDDPGDIVA